MLYFKSYSTLKPKSTVVRLLRAEANLPYRKVSLSVKYRNRIPSFFPWISVGKTIIMVYCTAYLKNSKIKWSHRSVENEVCSWFGFSCWLTRELEGFDPFLSAQVFESWNTSLPSLDRSGSFKLDEIASLSIKNN